VDSDLWINIDKEIGDIELQNLQGSEGSLKIVSTKRNRKTALELIDYMDRGTYRFVESSQKYL
jgi:hypothetical protein